MAIRHWRAALDQGASRRAPAAAPAGSAAGTARVTTVPTPSLLSMPTVPPCCAHDALDDHQPEAVPAGLGRVVRLEQLRQVLLPDAHAGIAEHEVDGVVVGPRPDLQLAPRPHRLHRVGDEVEEHLLQLVAVGQDRGQVGLGLGLDRDAAVLQLAGLEPQHLVEHVDHVGLGQVRRPGADAPRENW